MATKNEDLKPTPTQEELNAIASGKPVETVDPNPAEAPAAAEDTKTDEDKDADAKKRTASYSNRQAKAD